MKTQWLSPKSLKRIQNMKLREIITYAYGNVPYYHEVLKERRLKPEDIKDTSDLAKLPFLTKDMVRNNFTKLQARNIQNLKPILQFTSGSTGKPLSFYITMERMKFENALAWRHWNWAGCNPGDRRAEIRYGVEPYLWWQKRNVLRFSSYHMTTKNAGLYVNRLREFDPKVIRGFPSSLYILARYMKREGVKFKVKSVITASETLFDEQRKDIEEQFGCKVFDWYGLNECVVTASECPEGNYHINSEGGIMEFIKDEEYATPSETAEIVGTQFGNYAMPLIRYRHEDLGSYTDERCSCGRGLPILKSLLGRTDDMIVTPDGRLIGRLDDALKYSLGIYQIQLIQKSVEELTIKVVKGPSFSEKGITRLEKELRKRLGNEIRINTAFVNNIPKTKTGKCRVVISEIPLKL